MGPWQILKPPRACDLRALRFVSLFAIFGRPSGKLVKDQLQLTHNLKISDKE
jgi:hypothetical protein